jgi:4a-hydroxytetrahydrobiopterin dehydratase
MRGLTDSEIAKEIVSVPAWHLHGKAIIREWTMPRFLDAIAFVNKVAELAEKEDHHPDILIRYNKVQLRLSTHDADGLSERDFHFAKLCDAF